ncbi:MULTISPECIES: PstS family phosphate ABC transporter substrate-binding protein [Sphaerochaeta]|nr:MULTISPECIES: PstS family phosphate ABC transporter substrate-binding protein [Sphaerochaeta]MDT3359986.1 PstS family phosphate ABC transporter substrate-binding protein [Spirochaetota bacterium]MDD2394226.1 PstS family phosphate ABC transporter substrate-binding protein [Sphaerochaeta sp.]MDD3424501.1 PstS family phosphate ABC transporter substrate-binding protein [Sphaerochaeta sp.]MDD3455463.1 PstS family phosphate ABC transporter substrate-binding protein [Sphaerochaeta sp.]MDD4037525.1
MKKLLAAILASFVMMTLPVFAGGAKEPEPVQKNTFSWVEDGGVAGLPGVNPLKVSGNIITAGSSTVYPLSERMAERFKQEGYSGVITIDSIGSGAGFERFTVAGETDIANASRAIKAKEIEAAKQIGRNPIEFRVGTDALAVVVSNQNTFAKNLTKDELAKLFSTASTWSEINPAWPKEKIQRFIPGTDSGTFDYFSEEVFKNNPQPMLSAQNLQLSEDDNILVQGIKGSPYAVGFFGYAYYAENADSLTILSINGVEASKANVDNGTYPLARPLYIYSDEQIMRTKPQVAAFIDFYLSYVNEEVIGVGYFPANEDELEKGRQAWLKAMNGTY